MNEMEPILNRWLLANYTTVKSFTFRKVSAKICNFRVPVNKGVPPHMNEMIPILKRQLVKCTTVKSLTFRKDSANLYNLRVAVYKGFSSHEWKETLH